MPVRTAGEAVSRPYRRCRRQHLASAAVSAGPATVTPPGQPAADRQNPQDLSATQGKDRARTGRSELLTAHRTCPRTAAQSRQRGITSGGQDAPVTLSYLESVISLRKLRHLVPYIGLGWTAQGFLRAHRNPQLRDAAAGPHRNPTDETTHSGTLVMRVKGTENSRSAAPMRVSWTVGAFSR